ncbi:MAG: NADPH:quinone reductase [Actinomycetota bacterium]|jgi:NADPH2:quinone reductase|nr:NADPH:quinone reductase [Actinomycetota bacterium]
MRAAVVRTFGNPDVLQVEDIPEPQPNAGDTLIDVRHAGVNFADLHQIAGAYLTKNDLPFVPGIEVVGTDESGRRVFALLSEGYAERVTCRTNSVVHLPDSVTDEQVLALGLQGYTAWHILRSCARKVRGESVVVHGAAGGVGTIAVQLAKAWGAARVIAVASTQDKRDLALQLGADVAVSSDSEDMTAALVDANRGRPIDVVLEMVGGRILDQDLATLGPQGRLVVCGNASGEQSTPVPLESLIMSSRSVVGFWAADYLRSNPRSLAETLTGLFAMVKKGKLTPVIGGRFPLEDVGEALKAMSGRASTGKLVIDVRS